MNRVIVALEVGRQVPTPNPNNPPVAGWGVEMPVGSRIVRVGMTDSLQVLALVVPNAVKVWHPLLILRVGAGYTPLLGRDFGECFGVVAQGPVAFAVFADAPWPLSTLLAAATGGAA